MKKTVLALLIVFAAASSLPGQTRGAADSGPIDLVVLIDTSSGMSGSFAATNEYLKGPFLRDFLRIGDTFHLISFSREPRLEIICRVEGVGDIETIIGRMLLLYPIARETDPVKALDYAEKYASTLPQSRRQKIVLISGNDTAGTRNSAEALSSRLRSGRGDMHFIKVPITGTLPVSGRPLTVAGTSAGAGSSGGTAVSSTGTTPPPETRQPAQTTPSVSETRQPAQSAPSATETRQPAQTTPSVSETRQPVQTTPSVPETRQPTTQTAPSASETRQPVQTAPSVSETRQPAQTAPSAVQTAPSPGAVVQSGMPQNSGVSSPSQSQAGDRPENAKDEAPNQAFEKEPGISVVNSVIDESGLQAGSQSLSEAGMDKGPSDGDLAQAQEGTGRNRPVQQDKQNNNSSTNRNEFNSIPLIAVLVILALVILGFAVFYASRRLSNSPGRALAKAASSRHSSSQAPVQRAAAQKTGGAAAAQHHSVSRPLPKDMPVNQNLDFGNGAPMLSLFVADQNTAIGRRNIHAVKKGYTFTIGGGKSDFLIFMVPVPPRIADLVFDGKQCTLIPRRPEYFPDLASQQVPNCIGKTIRVITDKNYELHIRIERYEDPVIALNKLLYSIYKLG
ncbi:MAG: hypothetical protein LBH43_12870 [Treponema sp.]|jgi:hypothetical protein|nr:hypothetical protein [Treponema sp.]